MIVSKPELFMERFLGSLGQQSSDPSTEVFHPDALKEYIDQMRNGSSVHGMCEDYRSGATVDLEEQREDIKQGKKIQCPVTILWGKKGLIELKYDAIAEWKKVSDSSVEGEALDCGHYIPEEKPDILMEHIKSFFK
jgi:haloacetate dehalogenase